MESDTKLEWILSGDFHGNRVDGKEEKKKNTTPLLSYNYFRILSILPISLNWILLIYYKTYSSSLGTWYPLKWGLRNRLPADQQYIPRTRCPKKNI